MLGNLSGHRPLTAQRGWGRAGWGTLPGGGPHQLLSPTPPLRTLCWLPCPPPLPFPLSLSYQFYLLQDPVGQLEAWLQFSCPGRGWQAGIPQGAPEHLLGSETPWNRAQGGLRAGSQSSQPRQSTSESSDVEGGVGRMTPRSWAPRSQRRPEEELCLVRTPSRVQRSTQAPFPNFAG